MGREKKSQGDKDIFNTIHSLNYNRRTGSNLCGIAGTNL